VTEDDPVTDPIDTMQPWTIKSVPTRTRDAVTKAARQEGATVGQWLERRVDEWLEAGSPVRQPQSASVSDPVSLVQATIALAAAAPEKMREGMIRTAWKRVRHDLTVALPPPQRLLANIPRTPESRDSADESGAAA
jgi:hypothetical protein